jgi:NAD(P)-dependent dehydrogenase (short-subunit alcohol dehydrogenase family)
MLDGRLRDKVIIVAGAGGIGSGLARRYAAEGATVILGDIDGAAAERTAASIGEAGGRAAGVELDGADDASVARAVAFAVESFGGLDGFHANFACFLDGVSDADIIDLPLDVYDEMMRVNARGFVLCARHAVPAMLRRGGGSILFTSSGAVYNPEEVRCAYAMSKAAGHALMRHLAKRFGPQGIRANVIAPGVISHPRFEEVISPDAAEAMRQRNLLKRLGSPEDIAAMGALLLSDDGRFITGQVISVDGGLSMRH